MDIETFLKAKELVDGIEALSEEIDELNDSLARVEDAELTQVYVQRDSIESSLRFQHYFNIDKTYVIMFLETKIGEREVERGILQEEFEALDN